MNNAMHQACVSAKEPEAAFGAFPHAAVIFELLSSASWKVELYFHDLGQVDIAQYRE